MLQLTDGNVDATVRAPVLWFRNAMVNRTKLQRQR